MKGSVILIGRRKKHETSNYYSSEGLRQNQLFQSKKKLNVTFVMEEIRL